MAWSRSSTRSTPSILFSDYSFKTGTIPSLVKHFDGYAEWIVGQLRAVPVVEFGANDGTLIAALGERGIRGRRRRPGRKHRRDGQGRKAATSSPGFFGPDLVPSCANASAAPPTSSPAATCSPTTPTRRHPRGGGRSCWPTTGVLCLEVMYAGDLLELLQWDTLYHEHLTFYSLGR